MTGLISVIVCLSCARTRGVEYQLSIVNHVFGQGFAGCGMGGSGLGRQRVLVGDVLVRGGTVRIGCSLCSQAEIVEQDAGLGAVEGVMCEILEKPGTSDHFGCCASEIAILPNLLYWKRSAQVLLGPVGAGLRPCFVDCGHVRTTMSTAPTLTARGRPRRLKLREELRCS